MVNRRIIRLLALFLVLTLSTSIFAIEAQKPWYENQKIISFVNHGLVNVKENAVKDIEYKYQGKDFTTDLFNQLQGELYGMNNFLYFLADAQKSTDGTDSLVLDFTFFELPFVKSIEYKGNDSMKSSKLNDAITLKIGTFLQSQDLDSSKQMLVDLYHKNGFSDVKVEANATTDETTNLTSIDYVIDEGKQKKVGEVVFQGNEHFNSQILKKQLSTKISSYFTAGYYMESNIEEDKKNILKYYQNNGYIDAKFSQESIDVIPQTDANEKYIKLRITYTVDEGSLWKFGKITTEGNSVFSNEDLQGFVTLTEGDSLNVEKLNAIFDSIANKYWDNGYIFNNIEKQIQKDEASKTVSYHLVITENGQATISEIRLKGLTKTKPYVFMREMAFKVGDIFSKAKLTKSAQNIYNTLIVSDVQVDVLNGEEPNTVIPVFTVTEGNQMSIQFGATFGGTVDSFPISGFVQWSDKNIGGTGRTLSLSTTLSPDTQEAEISFGNNWVGDKRWANTFSLDFSRNNKSTGLQRGYGSGYYTGHDADYSFGQPYPLGYNSYTEYEASDEATPASRYLMTYEYWRIALGYTTGYTFMFDAGSLSLSAGLSIGLNRAYYNESLYDPYEYLMTKYHEGWKFSNKFNLGITWDGRDLKENTTKGYIVSQQFTYAGGILGGLSNYLKSSTSVSGYVSLFSYKLTDKPANVVLGATTTLSLMMPQFWNNTDSYLEGKGWGWYNPKLGATRYEMLYIDGMNVGRGFNVIYDQSFLWDNQISIGAPLVHNVLNWEVFVSATGIASEYYTVFTKGFSSINWYYALGAGIKLKIPGFPLALYLVKNAKMLSGGSFSWVGGSIFANSSDSTSGLKLVLAINQTIY
ncbi:MAG: outer membrane protein assembly factor BamA [Sphaerochaetaceae bacterium]